MAKVVNGGNKKGKIGNSIFYTIKNSNNKVTQGERIYQPNVTNPQSENQRAQRMKMKPATNFYAALSGILDHSFQGVKYGAMSRQYFLQQAIGKSQEVFPYLLKGESKFVPGPYLMSKGYLQSIEYYLVSGGLEVASTGEQSLSTLGDVSSELIATNTFLQNGDQLTFVAVSERYIDGVSQFFPEVSRLILNTESSENIDDAIDGNFGFGGLQEDNRLLFVPGGAGDGSILVAGCIIVSRKNVSGGEVWQRSTERMAVSERVYNMYMSPDAYSDALESYKRTAASYDSDYYLNDAETPEEVSGVESYSFTNGSVDFTLGGTTKTHAAVVVQNDNGPLLTCAKFGVYEDETPTGDTAWIETYIVRGRTIVLMSRYDLQANNPQSITAAYEGKTIQVLTPEAFVARFKDFSIA